MTGLDPRAPAAVCGLHNGGVVMITHDGTRIRKFGKLKVLAAVKDFVFVGGFANSIWMCGGSC